MSEYLVINTDQYATPKPTAPVYEPYPLVQETSEILFKPVEPFQFDKYDAHIISHRLLETLKKNKILGLSANQCGLEHNVFVMGAEDNYVACFNPIISAISEETEMYKEICPNYPYLELNIARPKIVTLQYQDIDGKPHAQTYSGITARIVHKQVAQLNGLPFVTEAKPLALEYAYKRREKKLFKLLRSMRK